MDNNTKQTEKKIEILSLVNGYKERESDKVKEAYLNKVIRITPYISYGVKCYLADNIINSSCLDENGRVKLDSAKQYLLFIYALLSAYTNVDISSTELMQQYDLLEEYGLLEKILDRIPKSEVDSFRSIVEMKQNDLMTNKYEIHSFISENLSRYTEFFRAFGELLMEKVDNLDKESMDNITQNVIGILKK